LHLRPNRFRSIGRSVNGKSQIIIIIGDGFSVGIVDYSLIGDLCRDLGLYDRYEKQQTQKGQGDCPVHLFTVMIKS
jgi:hypothetical protein